MSAADRSAACSGTPGWSPTKTTNVIIWLIGSEHGSCGRRKNSQLSSAAAGEHFPVQVSSDLSKFRCM